MIKPGNTSNAAADYCLAYNYRAGPGSHGQGLSERGLLSYAWGAVSRVHRLRTTDRMFFVTVNLRRRVAAFGAPKYGFIIDALNGSRHRHGFLLCGCVLMPDHWHALIWTGYPLTISRVVHDVKKVSARRVHGRCGTGGALWQHQFWDRFVRHEKEFQDCLQYMHLNPVRKGLVNRPEEWRRSSYNNFSVDRGAIADCPIEIGRVVLPEGYGA